MSTKLFGVVPDMVYGKDKFGPANKDTVYPYYVLLSDYMQVESERDALQQLLNQRDEKIDSLQQMLGLRDEQIRSLKPATARQFPQMCSSACGCAKAVPNG